MDKDRVKGGIVAAIVAFVAVVAVVLVAFFASGDEADRAAVPSISTPSCKATATSDSRSIWTTS